MEKTAVFTIVSKNYISYSRVLFDSFFKNNKDCDAFVLLVDKIDGYFDPSKENFKTIEVDQLEIPNRDSFIFKYNIMELNTAVKPFFIEYLFKHGNYSKVIYFDPDILILRGLGDLFDILNRYSIVLIPHITSPIPDDGKAQSEIEIMRAGCYNLGFIALSNYERIKGFLNWWQDRLNKYCFSAPEVGLFVDQKWIDLVPCMYDGVYILKHPGYNVAYWNLHERKIQINNGEYFTNSDPLFFYHFSGIDINNLDMVSKYQNRFKLKDVKNLKGLFENYKDLLIKNGISNTKDWPYSYDFFDDGTKIPSIARRLYWKILDRASHFGNPSKTSGETSFLNWLNSSYEKGSTISNLLYYIYTIRPDLQNAFPDIKGDGEKKLIDWAFHSLTREYGVDKIFLEALKKEKREESITLTQGNVSLVPKKFRFEELLWKYGIRYASFIKKIPILRDIAEKIFTKLARKRYQGIGFQSSPQLEANLKISTPEDESQKKVDGTLHQESQIGINIAGYITSESGTGEAVRGNIRAFESADLPHVLINLETQYRQEDKTYTSFSENNPYRINYIHVNADQVPVFYSQKGDEYFKGKYNIGFWVWELSEFPRDWWPHFRLYHEIWTPSSFCVDALSIVSPIPVIKIPHSVVINQIKDVNRSYFKLPEDHFIFLFIFDMLSYFERKNPLALIEAFKKAFKPEDDVMLVLKLSNSERNISARDRITEATKGLRVKMIDQYLYKDELHALMRLSDCYVSLHRSEGFGLPLAEAMYLQKPVIATAYSGNVDFMNVNNSFLVKYKMIEIEDDAGPYKKGNIWADPDPLHASELMRYVYENREIAQKIGEKGSEDIKSQLSPEQVGKRIRRRIDRILSTH